MWATIGSLSRQLIWPPDVLGKLGRLFGALSVIGLAQHGFNVGLGPTLLLILNYYNKAVGALLGWADPYINLIVVRIAGWLDWNIILYPHWRHIFVLCGLYFFRGAGADYKDGNPITGTFRLLMGFVFAVAISVVIGVVPLTQGNMVANFLVAAIPLLGITVNDVAVRAWRATFTRAYEAQRLQMQMPNWWGYFGKVFYLILGRAVIGVAIVYLGLQISIIRQLPSPGLALLALLVLALALHQLNLGIREAKFIRRGDENWRNAAGRSRGTIIALGMLGVAWWVGIFLVLNAGLQIFDL